MDRLIALALSVASQDIGAAARRAKRNVMLIAISAVFFVTAYIAAIIGGALMAARYFGPVGAAFVIAIAALAIALLILAAIAIWDRVERKRLQRRMPNRNVMMAAAAVSIVPSILKSRLMVAGLIAGGVVYVLLGRKRD